MQTFLPYSSFSASAEVLDDRRLGKQRVEALQILRALHLPSYGWATHPAVLMWRGHTRALVAYGGAVVEEWRDRGHADGTWTDIAEFVHPRRPETPQAVAAAGLMPPWLGWPDLHVSHRSALLRKDPELYQPVFADIPDDLPYVWPDPPAPAVPPGPLSGWVVRDVGGATAAEVAITAEPDEVPWVPLDARTGRRTARLRQVQALHDLSVGAIVAVPDAAGLRVGRTAGPVVTAAGRHRVRVRWAGDVERSALRAPAVLQHPQLVFPLHDEPVVVAAAG